jgi:hypothetical protein
MGLVFEDRASDSSSIDRVWRSHGEDVGEMTSIATTWATSTIPTWRDRCGGSSGHTATDLRDRRTTHLSLLYKP